MLGLTQEVLKNRIRARTVQASEYSQTEEEKKLYNLIREDLDIGNRHLTKSWEEFNGRTLAEEMTETQRAFNTYIEPRREDPLHSWRAQTRRPILRNKLINTIAHATKATLIPGIFAYDENAEEKDELGASTMKSMINWVIQNSDYAQSFVDFVTQIVSQPAGIMEVGYQKVLKTIRHEDGTTEEVIDDVLSGYFFDVVPCNELIIDNPYEFNIQRQRFIARRKLISFADAKAIYGNLKNFKYVNPGMFVTVDTESGMFYSVKDDASLQGRLVEEITYYNRLEDLEVKILNGVMVGDPFAGISYAHKKYPFVKTVYESINAGKFFWGKSQANKLLPDEQTINVIRNMFIDGTFLQLMPPFAIFGDEEPHQVVMVPGATTAFEEEIKIQNVAPTTDITAGLSAMSEVEKSMIETTSDPYRAGSPANLPDRMPAYNMAKLQENAETQLGLLMKSLGFGVTHASDLLISNIIQYSTIPEVVSAVGSETVLKYPSFLINGEDNEGQEVSKKINFNPDFFASKKSALDRSYDVMKKEGMNNNDERIIIVNPEAFRNLKYKAFTGSDTLQRRNSIIDKALKLEAYDRLRVDPIIASNAESMRNVTKDFLIGAVAEGKAARYLPSESQAPVVPMGADGEAPTQNITGQITGSNSLEGMMAAQADEEATI